MKTLTAAFLASALAVGPAMAQQLTPNQYTQSEADKGIKTHNSGASGMVGSQATPGAAAHPRRQRRKYRNQRAELRRGHQ